MKRRLAIFAALALAAALGSAAPVRADDVDGIGTIIEDPVFTAPSDAELAAMRGTGDARIVGRYNLIMNGSVSRLEYTGYRVYLAPATPWAYAWAYSVARVAEGRRAAAYAVPAWMAGLLRHTTTDTHGNYTFENLPPGRYVVVAPIETVVSYDDSYSYPTYQFDYDLTLVTDHYVENVLKCNVSAALESVVDVTASQTTVAPTDIAGWRYSGQCLHRNRFGEPSM